MVFHLFLAQMRSPALRIRDFTKHNTVDYVAVGWTFFTAPVKSVKLMLDAYKF